jgi:hypothetical protein
LELKKKIIASSTTINVKLKSTSRSLEEVVVTSFGIKETKNLWAIPHKINATELTAAKLQT